MQSEQPVPRSINNPAQAFLSVPTPLIITTLSDERFVEVNESFLQTTGFQRAEMIGRTSLELNLWPEKSDREKFAQKLKEQSRVADLEMTFRMRSGELRNGLLSAALIELSGEQCVVALWHDITDRKQAEEELQEQKKLYHHLVEHSMGLMCTHDLNGVLLSVNSASMQAIGFRKEDAIGRNLRDFLTPSVRHKVDAYLDRIRQNRTDSGLMHVVARNGEERVWLYGNVR